MLSKNRNASRLKVCIIDDIPEVNRFSIKLINFSGGKSFCLRWPTIRKRSAV